MLSMQYTKHLNDGGLDELGGVDDECEALDYGGSKEGLSPEGSSGTIWHPMDTEQRQPKAVWFPVR